MDSEILLSATYCITVYATADAYEKSEISYASIKWIDGLFDSANNIVSMSTPKRAIIVTSDGQALNIKGLHDGEEVNFYSMEGIWLGNTQALNNQACFTVHTKDKIIVCKIGNESMKVLMK